MKPTTSDRERVLALGRRYDAAMHALYQARAIINAILQAEIIDSLPLDGPDAEQAEDVTILLSLARQAVEQGLADSESPKADQ